LGDEHELTLMVVNNLAWQLATALEAEDRDPKRAIALAESCVRIRESAADFCTLGAAHIAAEDWEAAISSLQRSLQLVGKDDITSVRAELLLCHAYVTTKQLDLAKASLETVHRLMPEGVYVEDTLLLSLREQLVLTLEPQISGEPSSE
jgi:lipopolysaccharide biosynthesis regulator YciM